MKKIYNGRTVNIPDAEIENLMKNLDCSEEEAIDVWASDNGFEENEEQNELDAKASKVRVNKNASGERKERKPRPPRKANEEKRDIINYLSAHLFLDTGFQNVTTVNPEREITFNVGDNEYSITLICHRKKG